MPVNNKIKLIIEEMDKASFNLEKLKADIVENNQQSLQNNYDTTAHSYGDLFSESSSDNATVAQLESENKALKTVIEHQKILLTELLQELNSVMEQVNSIEKAIK